MPAASFFCFIFSKSIRFKILSQVHAMLDSPNSWHSISYSLHNSFACWIFLLSLMLFFFAFKKCFASNRNLRLLVSSDSGYIRSLLRCYSWCTCSLNSPYINAYENHPIKTQWTYFWKAFGNIVFKGARSS